VTILLRQIFILRLSLEWEFGNAKEGELGKAKELEFGKPKEWEIGNA
jgi:hypothetical protein